MTELSKQASVTSNTSDPWSDPTDPTEPQSQGVPIRDI